MCENPLIKSGLTEGSTEKGEIPISSFHLMQMSTYHCAWGKLTVGGLWKEKACICIPDISQISCSNLWHGSWGFTVTNVGCISASCCLDARTGMRMICRQLKRLLGEEVWDSSWPVAVYIANPIIQSIAWSLMSRLLALTSFSLSVAILCSALGNKSLEEVAFPNLLYTVIWNLIWLKNVELLLRGMSST